MKSIHWIIDHVFWVIHSYFTIMCTQPGTVFWSNLVKI